MSAYAWSNECDGSTKITAHCTKCERLARLALIQRVEASVVRLYTAAPRELQDGNEQVHEISCAASMLARIAECQAGIHTRKAEQTEATIRYLWLTDRRTRPQRWRDTVAELVALQAGYTAWAEAQPGNRRGTATADALQTIVDFHLSELADIEPPRGYRRD